MSNGRRVLLAGVVVVIAAFIALLVFTTGSPPARPPLPNPNGYDDFVNAGDMVPGRVGDYPTLDRTNLAVLVSTNAEALRLLRLGLTRRCVVPLDAPLTNEGGMLDHLAGVKRLAQLVAAEGRLLEQEDRPADAARSYTDAIRFGNETSRGGFLITRLSGIACEALGCYPLARIAPKLNCEQARAILLDLEKVEADRVTWAEVRRNEREFHNLHGTGFNPILKVVGWWQSRQSLQRAERRQELVIAHERLLAGELALRCYQSEKARVPTGLDELVPNYLSKVPEDPFSGQPLVYRAQGTNWLFYSVGPDGVDDGGKSVGRGPASKGDLFFDSSW